MHHYPRNVGDILKATMGMTLVERGAYDALLDQYYAHERPLPKDRREVYRMAVAIAPAERKAVDDVLTRFFTEATDGWHQKRADNEITAYRDKATKAAASAGKRWSGRNANGHANASPDAMRTHSEGISDGNAKQNQNHSSTTPLPEHRDRKPAPVDKSTAGPKMALNGEQPKAPAGWRRDPNAAAKYADALGIGTRRGEQTPELVSRIDEYLAELRRGHHETAHP